MSEVASAFVSLVPSARGFGRKLESQVGGQMRGVGGRLGGVLAKGMKVGLVAGAAGITALGGAFAVGLKGAAEYEKITARTANVLKTTGHVAGISAKGVKRLGSTVEGYSALTNEAVESGANLLLTFTNIRNKSGKTNKVFDKTTKAAADMAVALGTDVPSAALQLGKALNDPEKGMTRLMRSGVSFTDAQKAQVKALQDSGDMLGAQKVILQEVNKEFGGAAKAVGGTFAGSLTRLKNQFGDVLRDAVTPLLPALTRFVGFLAKRLPGAVDTARGVFRTLAKTVGRIVTTIGGIAGAVKDFFTIGAGKSALTTAVDKVRDGAKDIRDFFGTAADNFGRLKDNVTSLDFSKIDTKALGKTLADGIVSAVRTLGKSTGKVAKAIGDFFGKVDWVGLGIKVGTLALPFVVGLATGIINGVGDPVLWKGIWNHLPEILWAALAIVLAPSKVIGPIAKVLERIPFVGSFLSASLKWVNGLGGPLRDFGARLFRIFGRAFSAGVDIPGGRIVSRVLGALRGIPKAVGNFFAELGINIGAWAENAFQAMGRGAATGVTRLLRVVAYIPRKILAALGDLSGLLIDAGKAIITGLIKGIGKGMKPLKDTLGAVGGFIKDHKGPPKKDAVMLRPAGRLIMGGLISGIGDSLPDLRHQLQAVTSQIRISPDVTSSAGAIAHGTGSLPGAQFSGINVYAQDVNDFLRQMQTRARHAAIGGTP